MNLAQLRGELHNRNVRAFLRVIRQGETNQSADAYRMQFGGGLFNGWQHPNRPITVGQWTSTAAGAYQFLYRTWSSLVRMYGFADFSPECQDMGAVALIAGRGALDDVRDGRLDAAIARCAREWASLPGAPYGQPTLSLALCRKVFAQYGGVEVGGAAAKTTEEKATMDPLSLAGLLVGAFGPLIKAKAEKALGSDVGGQLADNLLDLTKAATGKTDPLEAVAVARQQPEIVSKLEQSAADWLSQLGPVLDKLHAYESAAWAAEEASRNAAADRGEKMDASGFWHSAQFWIAAFILANVSGVVFTVLYRDSFSSDMQSFVIGAIVGSALTAIISYFFGSSRSSAAKDVVIGQLAERRQ